MYGEAATETSAIQDALVAVYGDLLDFSVQARNVFLGYRGRGSNASIAVFMQSQWEPFEDRFGSIQSSMQHHLQVLGHAGEASMLISESARLQREELKAREDFLKWISSLSHDQRHRNVFAKKEPGTGEWLSSHQTFQKWLYSKTFTLLCCYGKPGAGKSVLASNVIETIVEEYGPQKSVGICFAYYDHVVEPLSQVFDQIVSSLMKQLCRKTTIPESFRKAKQNADSPCTLADETHFATIAREYKTVFLIIDALDECDEDEERPRLFRFFKDISRWDFENLPTVHIFVTSRREPDIVRELEPQRTLTIQIDARSIADDIKLYVQKEVTKLRSGCDGRLLYIKADSLAEQVTSRLIEGADGMFLWVYLQLRRLCKVSERREDPAVEDALNKMPTGLDQMYARIEQQIGESETEMQELAMQCLSWVFFAQRPLIVRQLQEAHLEPEAYRTSRFRTISPTDESVILSACANILEVEPEDAVNSRRAVIRPIHFSANQYFTCRTRSDSTFMAYLMRSSDIHGRLAIRSARELQLAFPMSRSPYTHRGFNDSWDHRLEREKDFTRYAMSYFDVHAYEARPPTTLLLEACRGLFSIDSGAITRMLKERHTVKGMRYHDFWSKRERKGIEPEGGSALILGSQLFHIDEFRALIRDEELPADAIHEAAYLGRLDVVEYLADHGVHIDSQDDDNCTALYWAAREGHIAVIQYLLQKGSGSLNDTGGDLGSALQVAASNKGHVEVVRFLIEAGATPNLQTKPYGSALVAAALRGDADIVQLLVDAGADPNLQARPYQTLAAALGGDTELDQFLIEAAAASGDDMELIQILIEAGADPDLNAEHHRVSALVIAVATGNIDTVTILLKAGAKVGFVSLNDGTNKNQALHCAVVRGTAEVLRSLLTSTFADVKQGALAYTIAIRYAVQNRNSDITQLLLDSIGKSDWMQPLLDTWALEEGSVPQIAL